MLCDRPSRLDAAKALLKILDVGKKDFLVTFYGEDPDKDEIAAFEAFVAESYPGVEFYGVNGGQEVYDYVFVLE